jgi:hypothetical protein
MSRRGARVAVAAAAAVGAAFALVVAAAVLVGGSGRDEFGGGSVQQVQDALTGRGLVVCDGGFDDAGPDGGAVSTRELEVGADGDCGETLILQIDAYGDVGSRDAAARAAEGRHRPRTFGTVFTWRQYTLYLQADQAAGDAAIRDGIVEALEALGAR